MIPSILIVEDDLTFSTMLKTWLGKKGFEVETAGTNARARKQIAARQYDLILSDLRLPIKTESTFFHGFGAKNVPHRLLS